MSSRYGASREDVEALLAGWGEPAYRARQVWDGLYLRRRPLERCTDLPASLRARLAEALPLAFDLRVEQRSRDGATTKYLWAAVRDAAQAETVLMEYPSRATVCVSSQAGCAMGCTFCATGQAGFERHLEAGEIVEQVVRAAHGASRRVGNVVYMGMGEPLANYDAVWASVARLHDDFGVSARHITVSTVGVAPAIRRLARERLPVTLAVSLHAPDDDLRRRLVPLDDRYPLAEVLDAAREFAAARGRRVTFEYACIAGVNDAPAHADALARLLAGFGGQGGAHVNLIPLNPTAGFPGAAPSAATLRAFAARLRGRGVNATVRRNRGTDIDAACGQLRMRPPAGIPEVVRTRHSPSATMGP
ncbi:MAG TPA: 23S rRNA (adenine(2503)-C(2))-methyltransferase RlmN [Acidimicrobiia bacterium]